MVLIRSQGKIRNISRRQPLDLSPEETDPLQIPKDIAKSIPGIAARGVESALGFPGNVASGVLSLVSQPFGGPSYEDLQKQQQQLRSQFPSIASTQFQLPPTGQQIKEGITEPVAQAVGVSLEPRGKISRFAQGVVENAVPLLFPLGGSVSMGTALKTGVAGQAVKEIVGALGGGKTAQEIGNLLGMIGYGMVGTRRNIVQEMDQAFEKVDDLAKAVEPAQAWSLENKLKNISEYVSKRDIPLEAKDFLKQRFDNILNKVKDGYIDMPSAIDSLRDINAWIRNPSTPEQAQKWLKQLNGMMNEFIIQKGTNTPNFVNAFKKSNELYGGINAVSSIGSYIASKVPLNKIKNDTVRSFITALITPAAYSIGGTALSVAGGTPGLALGGVVGLGSREAYKLYRLLQQSPIAKQIYKDVLKAAIEKNAPVLLSKINKMDQVVSNFEKKNKNWDQKEFKKDGIIIRRRPSPQGMA